MKSRLTFIYAMALIIVVVFVLEIFFLGIMSALLMLIGVGFGILLAIAS